MAYCDSKFSLEFKQLQLEADETFLDSTIDLGADRSTAVLRVADSFPAQKKYLYDRLVVLGVCLCM